MTLHKYKSPQWLIVSALGLVMIFTWGSTYYLLAILAEPIASDTSWSIGSVTGALSIGLLIASLSSPFVGRKIQNGSGRSILAIGCSLICTGLCTIGIAPNIWIFWTGWSVIGFGMAAGLYDPAFATLGKLYGRDARRSIVQLTLIGGFASTFCWPLSALMLETWGWRGTVFGYAAINATICFPIVIFLIPSSTNDVIQKEYQTMATELDSMIKEFEQQSLMMPEELKKAKEQDIIDMNNSMQSYQQAKVGANGELTKKQAQLEYELVQKFKAAVDAVAISKGYDIVMDGSQASLYTKPTHDLTDDVLYELRKSNE